MARLEALSPDAFDEATRSSLGPAALEDPAGLGLLPVLALRPDLTAAFLAFRSALSGSRTLPPRLIELARLRVAFHNQCRSCMALRSASAVEDGLTEGLVCEIAQPQESEELNEAEKAAVAYADLLVTDHLGVDDALFDRLRLHFTEPEIVELGVQLAVFVGFGRLSATWDVVAELPERFRDREAPVTPWGDGAVVAGHR
jgi:AhpD family alkylhydroperoxidase